MKYIILILFLLMGISAKSQTVGDHMSVIKANLEGEFYTSGERDYPYFYIVSPRELETDIVYFLNRELICTNIKIQPKNPDVANVWIQYFNESWVVVSKNKWGFIKEDGMVLGCELIIMENIHYSFDHDQYEFYVYESK